MLIRVGKVAFYRKRNEAAGTSAYSKSIAGQKQRNFGDGIG